MKYIILLFCLNFLSSCSIKKNQLQPEWLVGNWERTNNESFNKTYENWVLNSENKLIGLWFTIKDKDTIFKEELSIISKNDSLYIHVIGVNENPTLFKFTGQTATSFVCENSANEFPKKITYHRTDNNLNTVVSNEYYKIEFFFKKQND